MKRIDTRQTKYFIADAIRNEILSGKLKPGEELTQEKLAEDLEVSRMPIREALHTLESEGFVERMSNRHMRVAILEKENIQEVFQVISAIEAKMATILAEKGAIQEEIEEYRRMFQDKPENICEIEMMFHRWIGSKLNNVYLLPTYNKLLQGYVSYTISELRRDVDAFLIILNQFAEKMQEHAPENDLKALLDMYYEKLAAVMIQHFEAI